MEKAAWEGNSSLKAQAVLLEAALRQLSTILRGDIPATDVIFPNSSMRLVEGIYKNNTAADYFNDVVGDSVISYLKERLKVDPSVRIKILEIGAGTEEPVWLYSVK